MKTLPVRNRKKRLPLSFISTAFAASLAVASYGQVVFTNLFVFTSADTNGVFPQAALVEGRSGDLYGTTAGVRMNGSDRRIRPTIFKISPEGVFLTLAWFDATNANRMLTNPWGSDETLTSSLLQSADGNFYGVAEMGGEFGYGRIFKMNPSGRVTTLHSFEGYGGTNGWGPMGGLIEGRDGWLYGTAYNGGIKTRSDNVGMGTVYKVNINGSLKTLFYFSGTNGEFPASSLLVGKDGCFYGTTPYGGPAYAKGPPEHGFGTVFRITPDGTPITLFSFNGTNGSMPYAGLVQGRDGNFYGTTRFGGVDYGVSDTRTQPSWALRTFGTVFRITPSGGFTTLFSFSGTNGARPSGALVQGKDGYFYGTTAFGAASYRGPNAGIEHLFNETFGTIFRISSNGGFTSLFSFAGTNGSQPSGLVQARNGMFYGTTHSGGMKFDGKHEFGAGTVFRFNVTSPSSTVDRQ